MNRNQHFETLRENQTVFKKAIKNSLIESPEYIQTRSGRMVPIAQYTDYSDIEPYLRAKLAQALPPYLSESDFLTFANFFPKRITDADRALPSHLKYARTTSIQKLYRVTTASLTVFRDISEMIRSSYSDKMHAGETGNSVGGMTIYGISSQGKTSAVNMALSYYPQIIAHTSQSKKFEKAASPIHENLLQVTWLSVVCPSEGGQMSLCNNILAKVDDLLGSNYEENFKQSLGRNTEIDLKTYIGRVKQVIREIHLGILVIDDIQLLAQKDKKNRKQIANFLVELIQELEVPICLVGTLEVINAFKHLSFSFKSKFTKHGDIYFEPFPPNPTNNKGNKNLEDNDNRAPKEYEDLITFLFERYQSTKETLTEGELKKHYSTTKKNVKKESIQIKLSIIEQFYYETAGITQYTILLFIAIQKYIIEDELKVFYEEKSKKDIKSSSSISRISPKLISKLAKKNFKISRNYSALSKGILQ
ncbi:TniB family NTP-binding protein [Endozoicomonas sp. SCSIO W0465]|uniref:TniB family NTP-binding protein n=1 Tax=Endozoicomonas sp. SCSIO W0465 TaxID=2918516 RepID=UPI002075E4CC|nr:TniB family NTP-binding protein [Endozoicomonas sp. SCSIO W0465]USE34997.1 TniB family NTP-binding protein [Endozoicomonas sp. SCSIO W0465]